MPAEFFNLTQLNSISDCLVQITAFFFKITDLNNSHMIIILVYFCAEFIDYIKTCS